MQSDPGIDRCLEEVPRVIEQSAGLAAGRVLRRQAQLDRPRLSSFSGYSGARVVVGERRSP